MDRKVRKAIIPAAGLGTRFLPATKTVPKEMLPIVDRPIILHIVEEAAESGIEDIVIVAGRNKNAIEDFFDVSYELEDKLERDGKSEWVQNLQRIRSLANVISIRQKQPLGLGHAVLCGRPVVGDEPFAVLLGDEIIHYRPGEERVITQLKNSLESTGLSTVSVMQVAKEDVSKYGICEGKWGPKGEGNDTLRVQRVMEKPGVGETDSRWALPGRYVFSSEIFSILETAQAGKNGEIQLSDAMQQIASGTGLLARALAARRYDAGDKLGFLQANIELALDRPELALRLRPYLIELVKDFNAKVL